jgi:hypothetical protein
MEKVGMRGRFRESEPLRIVERPPPPRILPLARAAPPGIVDTVLREGRYFPALSRMATP